MGSQLAGAVSVPIGELEDTLKSLALAASKAGYSVSVQRNELGSTRLAGRMHGWAFSAILTISGRWEVGMRRPGWPDLLSDVRALRAVFKAQTPVGVGRAK